MKYPQCDKLGYAGTWWDTAGWKTATLLQPLKQAAIRFFAYPGRARACLEAKHKTQFDGLSTSVLHAAEQYTFGRDKGKSGSGSLPATADQLGGATTSSVRSRHATTTGYRRGHEHARAHGQRQST